MDKFKSYFHTVDGRNPASVEVCSLSHSLQGFIHPKWLAGFQNVGWIPASMIKQHKYNTSYILTYFHLPRLHQQRESIWIWMIMNEWLQAIRLFVLIRIQCLSSTCFFTEFVMSAKTVLLTTKVPSLRRAVLTQNYVCSALGGNPRRAVKRCKSPAMCGLVVSQCRIDFHHFTYVSGQL